MEHTVETTIVYRGYIGILEKKRIICDFSLCV